MLGYKTLLGCLIFIVLWSSGWIGSKYGQGYAGAFTLLAYRYMIVVLVLLVFVSLSKAWRSLPRSQLGLHVCVGVLSHAIFLGAGNSAFALGVSAGLVAFIAALQPLMTATLSPTIAGERISFRQWSGLALGFAAIMLVVSDRIALGGSALGYSLPFIAIVAISVASLIDRRISLANEADERAPTPLSLIALIHSSSALVVMVGGAVVFEGFEARWGGELVFSILWLAFVVSLGAYGMMFYMLRRISAVKVASLGYLSPPITMLIAYFVFGERLSTIDFLGLFFAGLAVWLVISKQGVSHQGSDSGQVPGQRASRRVPNGSISLATQGLFSAGYIPSSSLREVTLDIDLGEPLMPSFEFPGGQALGMPRISSTTDEAVTELEELKYFRKHQIQRLNQLVFNLRDSHDKIEALRGRVSGAESFIYDSVLDEIELKRACDELQHLVDYRPRSGVVDQRVSIDSAESNRPGSE